MEDFNSKYTGEQVEEFLDQIANGEIGGGITVETDPVFSASPAASINEEKIAEWDAKSEQGEKGDKGDKGDTGVGVQSVAQTTTSNADGGSNVVTVTLTDGTTSTFTVKNGSKGSQGIQGIQGEQGPKGDAGEGGGGSSGGGVETISLLGGFGTPLIIEEMLAEKRYWLYVDGLDGNEESIVIGGFEGDGVVDGAHIRHFYAVIECVSNNEDVFNVSLSLPDVDIRWSTGIPIPIRGNGRYELSIAQVCEAGYAYYNAVLTSFS